MFIVDETTNAIKLTKGDTAKITVSFTDEGGNPYDFSEDTVVFAVKRSAFDAEPVIEKNIDSATGKLELQRDDTINMEYGDYIYTVTIEHLAVGEDESETMEFYTPIVSKFSLGFNVI